MKIIPFSVCVGLGLLGVSACGTTSSGSSVGTGPGAGGPSALPGGGAGSSGPSGNNAGSDALIVMPEGGAAGAPSAARG